MDLDDRENQNEFFEEYNGKKRTIENISKPSVEEKQCKEESTILKINIAKSEKEYQKEVLSNLKNGSIQTDQEIQIPRSRK